MIIKGDTVTFETLTDVSTGQPVTITSKKPIDEARLERVRLLAKESGEKFLELFDDYDSAEIEDMHLKTSSEYGW